MWEMVSLSILSSVQSCAGELFFFSGFYPMDKAACISEGPLALLKLFRTAAEGDQNMLAFFGRIINSKEYPSR